MIALALSMALAAAPALAPPPNPAIQFHAQVLIMQVPAGFAEEVGLAAKGDADEQQWVLTPREARMLDVAVRRQRERDRCDVLSRPQLIGVDGQEGFFRVGQQGPGGEGEPDIMMAELTTRFTARLAADGSAARVRLEALMATPADRGCDVKACLTTAHVPLGHTLVLRGPGPKSGGAASELFVIATVTRLAPPPAR